MARNTGVRITFDEPATSDDVWGYLDSVMEAGAAQKPAAQRGGKTKGFSLKDLYGDTDMVERGIYNLITGGAGRTFENAYDLDKFGWQSVNDKDLEVVKNRKRMINRRIVENIYNGGYSSEPAAHWKKKIADAADIYEDDNGNVRWNGRVWDSRDSWDEMGDVDKANALGFEEDDPRIPQMSDAPISEEEWNKIKALYGK